MKKRILAVVLALAMVASLAACGGSSNGGSTGGSSAPANKPSSTATAVTEDGRDADGNIVDLTAYAISLGKQWFTEEDEEIWANIEEPSKNPDKIIFRWGTTTRSFEESPSGRGGKRMFIELKKALGDRIEIQIYYNATLGGTADQILGGLQAGNFEGYSYNVGAFYEYTKAFTPLDIGFLIPNLAGGTTVSDPENESAQIMKQKCIDDAGLYVIDMCAIGMRHITNCKKTISELSDIAGMKIRVQNNNLHMAMFDALGASPTPIAFSELFTALQQKTVDGQENPVANIFEQNYAEVQQYMTLSNHLYTAGANVISYDWYMALPEDVQQAVYNAAAASTRQSAKDLANCESEMLEYLGTRMEVVSLSDAAQQEFTEKAMGMWSQGADVMGQEYYDVIIPSIQNSVKGL